jgi:hypothetical protein
MSEPVQVTRAMLVALLEEIGDDDPCGRAIIETALEFGDVLYKISHGHDAWGLCQKHEWTEAPQ